MIAGGATLDNQFKTNTIEELTKLLNANYVFPETAVKISNDLIQRLHNSEFESTNDQSRSLKSKILKRINRYSETST
jgi:hypothetical protein